MKAVTWQGRENVQVDEAQDPRIVQPTDAVIRVTSTRRPMIQRAGMAHVKRWVDEIMPLAEAPQAYEKFQRKQDGMFKMVFQP